MNMLTKHIALEELTASDVATRHGIDNDLPIELRANALGLAEMLERIRGLVGKPLLITSGYRCPALNAMVGSRASSDHTQALAADFRFPGWGDSTAICTGLQHLMSDLGIGQLINEYPGPGGWVHVSTKAPFNPINRVITISKAGFRVGVHP